MTKTTRTVRRLAAACAIPLGITLFGGPAIGQAGPDYLTGCLSNGGSISKLAYGDDPAAPCGKGQEVVQVPLGAPGDGTTTGDGGSAGEASVVKPFYLTLDGVSEETIIVNGPLEYFARCVAGTGTRDRVQIYATSIEDGWWDEDAFSPLRADAEIMVFQANAASGQPAYNNDINEGSVIAADGSYIGIDGNTLGLGLNMLGHDCVVVGSAVVISAPE